MEDKKINDLVKVFFSWQDDLPKETNRIAIKHSIINAIMKVENEIQETSIHLEEATSNIPGSPNIPKSIMDKIDVCDIFICDLTTINSICGCDVKKVPNPNVLIELGYAIATIGWNRIILLYNTLYGQFPNDVPFDIDRHRITTYKISAGNDNNGKGNLVSSLVVAINEIIKKSPFKPFEERQISPEAKKRANDVANLKLAMSCVNINLFDKFITRMPKDILGFIFFYQEDFYHLIESNNFYIYDPVLKKMLYDFNSGWNEILTANQYYEQYKRGDDFYYKIPFDEFVSEHSKKEFFRLLELKLVLEKQFKQLLNFVRENYIEVDLKETSQIALDKYISFNQLESPLKKE